MTTDQHLRARLAEVISTQSNALDIAEVILDYPALLDEICEYRARQLNAERSKPIGVADVARFTAVAGFARAQMYREAAASVALDRDETYAAGGSDE